MSVHEGLHADPVTGESSSKEQRSMAALSHALTLLGYIGVPFANILAPLIIMLVDKGPGDFVKNHARESLNFHITMMIAVIINVLLMFVLIGFATFCVQFIFTIVVVVQASMAANEGRSYVYPLTIRFLT